jgi:Zn-finger nucleic acid-binding protein
MKCPKCKTVQLKQAKPANTKLIINYCSQCKGTWFDDLEFEELVPESIKKLYVPSKIPATSFKCPRCKAQLYEFSYPQTGINIDMCKSCSGLWIDFGELKDIQQIRKSLQQSGKIQEVALSEKEIEYLSTFYIDEPITFKSKLWDFICEIFEILDDDCYTG